MEHPPLSILLHQLSQQLLITHPEIPRDSTRDNLLHIIDSEINKKPKQSPHLKLLRTMILISQCFDWVDFETPPDIPTDIPTMINFTGRAIQIISKHVIDTQDEPPNTTHNPHASQLEIVIRDFLNLHIPNLSHILQDTLTELQSLHHNLLLFINFIHHE